MKTKVYKNFKFFYGNTEDLVGLSDIFHPALLTKDPEEISIIQDYNPEDVMEYIFIKEDLVSYELALERLWDHIIEFYEDPKLTISEVELKEILTELYEG